MKLKWRKKRLAPTPESGVWLGTKRIDVSMMIFSMLIAIKKNMIIM